MQFAKLPMVLLLLLLVSFVSCVEIAAPPNGMGAERVKRQNPRNCRPGSPGCRVVNQANVGLNQDMQYIVKLPMFLVLLALLLVSFVSSVEFDAPANGMAAAERVKRQVVTGGIAQCEWDSQTLTWQCLNIGVNGK
uniref:Uncharacterized protein n=1 Tax=Globodera rostochiensis TaxID=31243 RepID=A0A914HXT8_GLORO